MVRILFSLLLVPLTANLTLAEPLITEFLAQNETGLKDEQGEASDWIEIHNPDDVSVNLEGYALTDSADDLTKWVFPRVTVPAGGYLLVFASGKVSEAPAPVDPRAEYIRRLREAGLPEQFIDRVPREQLEEFLQQMERQRRRVRLPQRRRPTWHASFKLSGDGEYLALVKPDRETVCHAYAPKFPSQVADVSYGIIGGSGEKVSAESAVGRLLEPTPGRANSVALRGLALPARFSHDAGFYEEPFALVLESHTPEAEIRYTLNGDYPTRENGMVYREPLTIGRTTILRAAVFREGYRAARPETRTFVFLDDVLRQSPNGEPPPGWPADYVNGQTLDYGMDPEIVGQEHTVEEVKEALQALPALSLVLPLESLFDRRTGIYVNANGRGRQWERASSLELLPLDGTPGFQVDGGLRVRGGFSRQGSNPKHGFRMVFRKEYGDGKLKYALFGDEGAEVFDKIDFRSSMNYSWAMGGGRANTLLRDVFSRDAQRDMGQPYTRSRFYHLYLNGHYWGIYMTQERSEAAYGATYLGGEKEDYDTIKTFGEVTDGTGEARGRLYRAAVNGFARDEDYFHIQGMNVDGSRNPDYERLVDVDNVIDYMLITFYTGDKDGPGGTFSTGNNYFSIYNRENPDGFKYFEHDSEHSLGTGVDDITGSFLAGDRRGRSRMISERQYNVHWLHTRLAANPHYLERFTERTEMHFFGDGVMTTEACLARLEAREKTIDRAIIAHSARWGDAKANTPRTRQDWLAAVGEIKQFIATRQETVLRQLHGRGWYTGLPSPRFNRSGGLVASGFKCFVLDDGGGGETYVTTDGSDPRGADGQPAAGARLMKIPQIERRLLLRSPSPVRALVPTDNRLGLRWIQPGFDDSEWITGRTGVGYDYKGGYEDLMGVDLEPLMYRKSTTAYMRTRFVVSDVGPDDFDELHLKMRYDDGFVAYLNGKRIVAANAPTNLDWQSSATTDHPDEDAMRFVGFPFDHAQGLLRQGDNLLAVHGLDGDSSSDFIITPEIEGIRYVGAEPLVLQSPGEVKVHARSRKGSKWSPMATLTFQVAE